MLGSRTLQNCSKGVLSYPLQDRIFCPLQFMILHRKNLNICTIPFVMMLAPQVMSRLGRTVNHRRWEGHDRNSMLVDVIPLGSKNRQRCRAWNRERGSPDCSYMPRLLWGVLVLRLAVPLNLEDMFLLWHISLTRYTCHLRK